MADHELVEDGERKRFAGTSAVPKRVTGVDAEQVPDRELGIGRGFGNGELGAESGAKTTEEGRA
jgi:hypothetical protein